MDLQYLHLLQDFRNSTGDFLTPFMEWISSLVVSVFPFVIFAFVYWCLDKKTARRLILGLAFGQIAANTLLKLTACVYRPWIKDPTIVPAGDSITSATGYSFPSAHTACAVYSLGAYGLIFHEKKKRIIAAIFFVLVAVVMFSRNYLGVHTPQDVLVGFAMTSIIVLLCKPLNELLDKKNSDIVFLLVSVVICVLCIIYIQNKSYPTDTVDGVLLVDPKKMIPDGYWGLGALSALAIGNVIDTRFIRFEHKAKSVIDWIISVILVIPVFLLHNNTLGTFSGFEKIYIRFLTYFTSIIYITVIAPLIIKLTDKIKEKR